MSIKLDCIRVGMLETNCYMVYDEFRKEAIITDPGDNAAFIEECAKERDVKPVAIFLTHAHADHILALEELRDHYDIPVYLHEADVPMLSDGRKNLGGQSISLREKDVQLKGGETDLVLTNAHDFEDWLGCEIVVFKTVPAQIVVSSKHPWVKAGKKKITKKDMAEADILLLEKHGPYEFNSFYAKVKAKSRMILPDFDSMMIELEKGKRYGVFPMVFNDAKNADYVCYDLPDDWQFNFRTMCACRTQKASPELKKIFQYIKKHKNDFSF